MNIIHRTKLELKEFSLIHKDSIELMKSLDELKKKFYKFLKLDKKLDELYEEIIIKTKGLFQNISNDDYIIYSKCRELKLNMFDEVMKDLKNFKIDSNKINKQAEYEKKEKLQKYNNTYFIEYECGCKDLERIDQCITCQKKFEIYEILHKLLTDDLIGYDPRDDSVIDLYCRCYYCKKPIKHV